jgi:hypothetical protein
MSEALTELQSTWMQKVLEHQKNLRDLIANYHPAMNQPKKNLPITAPNAERACEVVRESIRTKEPQNPLERWDKAIQEKNIPVIDSLLNGAWFGVPESTYCWGIPGFREAVDLMDDPPYERGDYDKAD